MTGAHASIAEHVITRTTEAFEFLSAQRKRILMWGTLTATNEPAGSSNYTIVQAINEGVRQINPNGFVPIREYLVNRAIYDLGLTPTAEEVTAMNGDTIPPQIMADGVHYKKSVAPLIAAQFDVALTRRDWKAS